MPATLYLVRHGQAAAGFDSHLDPGLAARGRLQAEATAAQLAVRGPLPIYSSPLARARETAAPLARRWGTRPLLEPRVSELPSPTQDLAERARLVRNAIQSRWPQLGADLKAWRESALDWVRGLDSDAVVFTHFIAINAIVGATTGDDRVVVFRPDHASVTRCEGHRGQVVLHELGREADTEIR
jgi:broad specificity phosphatase PhoE